MSVEKVVIGNATLYRGDCLGILPMLTDPVDMVAADLPYGTTACKWDSVIPFEPLWKEYKRLCQGAVVLTASQPFTSALVMSNPKDFKHEWVWIKNKGSNYLNAKREPMKEHEVCLCFAWNPWQFNRILEKRSESGTERHKYGYNSIKIQSDNYGKQPQQTYSIDSELRVPKSYQRFVSEHGSHPTQKPVALFEYLIKTYTNFGMTVLDNTMGSGTTGVACINLGRNFIGIEQDAKYFDIACERITKAQEQLTLTEA